MKKNVIILVILIALFFCSCGSGSSHYSKAYDEGYEAGYEAGLRSCSNDADFESWSKMNRAAELVGKAIAIMDDFDSGEYSMDDLYDALCKADNVLIEYR